MSVLNKRVVVSKGSVPKKGKLHLKETDAAATKEFAIGPTFGAPLQQVWWTPQANLSGLSEFRSIAVKRAAIAADWSKFSATAKQQLPSRAGKIAVMIYAVAADVIHHNADEDLGQNQVKTRENTFALHTNRSAGGDITLTLPEARGKQGSELYFEIKTETADARNLIIAAAGGDNIINPDDPAATPTTVKSEIKDAQIVIAWAGPNAWTASDKSVDSGTGAEQWVFA